MKQKLSPPTLLHFYYLPSPKRQKRQKVLVPPPSYRKFKKTFALS